MPVTPALKRLKQDGHKVEAHLGYKRTRQRGKWGSERERKAPQCGAQNRTRIKAALWVSVDTDGSPVLSPVLSEAKSEHN